MSTCKSHDLHNTLAAIKVLHNGQNVEGGHPMRLSDLPFFSWALKIFLNAKLQIEKSLMFLRSIKLGIIQHSIFVGIKVDS